MTMASIPTQDEVLAATRKSREAMIAAVKNWLETVRTATPKAASVYASLTDHLRKLSSVSLPFADKLPTPQDAVANVYNMAEQLLADQRKFAEELLKAMTPLIPGRGESPGEPEVRSQSALQEAVVTNEPTTVPASTVPASTVPASTVPASTVPAGTAPAGTAPASTAPASTAPKAASARPAAKSTPVKSTPVKNTPAESTPAESTGAKSTGAKSTAAKSTATRTAPRTTAAKSAPKETPASRAPKSTDAS